MHLLYTLLVVILYLNLIFSPISGALGKYNYTTYSDAVCATNLVLVDNQVTIGTCEMTPTGSRKVTSCNVGGNGMLNTYSDSVCVFLTFTTNFVDGSCYLDTGSAGTPSSYTYNCISSGGNRLFSVDKMYVFLIGIISIIFIFSS